MKACNNLRISWRGLILGMNILFFQFFPFEDNEWEQMNQQVYFIDSFASGKKLTDCFGIARLTRVKLRAFLILQRIDNCFLDELFAEQ